MSHIVSFNIAGLAGRTKPLEVDLNRDTNVFFGLNGSGKTSLLKILHAAMDNETGLLASVPFSTAEVKIYSLNWNKVFTRSIEKKRIAKDKRRRARGVARHQLMIEDEVVFVEEPATEDSMAWKCAPETPKDAHSTQWSHKYLPTSRLHVSEEPYVPHFARSHMSRPWLTEDQLDTFFAQSVEHRWSRYSAQVLGAVRTAQEQGLASILRAVLSPQSARNKRSSSTLTAATAYDRVHSFMKRQGSDSILGKRSVFEKRYANDPTLQDVVQDIDSVEDKIKAAMTSRDSLQDLIRRVFTANKEIRFTDESIRVISPSGEQIGLASLSSGEKHLLRILVESLLAGENSLIIDEPEISMHVDWQKTLINSIRALNSEAQLIFATHSPEIMADLPDDKIFRI